MSLTYGFYNSVGGDRKYDASQISSLFDGVIRDGVFATISDALAVQASSGMTVIVKPGRAWFDRTWTNNDSDLPIIVASSEIVLNRIDTIVLEVNSNTETRANSIKIIKGTPATLPVATTMINTEYVHQYPLCEIYVKAGVAEIKQADMTNKIGTSACPFVTGILDTINIDMLVSQWNVEFLDWFSNVQSVLDGDTAGNLYNIINNKITIGTTTIPNSGWVVATGDDPLKINIPINNVSINDWVDVTVDKNYQDIAQMAEINPTVDEYDGGITIYAKAVPTDSIPIRYKVVK